jgi:hypothetical protein
MLRPFPFWARETLRRLIRPKDLPPLSPIRSLADILPGLANRSIKTLAELTPTTYAANRTK